MRRLYYDEEQAECTDCHEILPHGQFYPRNIGGRQRKVHYRCRSCEQKMREAKSTPYPYSDRWMSRIQDGTFEQTLFFDENSAQCRSCRRILPHDAFYQERTRGKRARTVQYECIDCERERCYQRRYGISRQVYLDMIDEQDGRCAICGKEANLVLDHCHETGRIRGLLCRPCNKALHWIERPEWMKAALSYLNED